MKNVMANNIFSTIVQSSWFFTLSMTLVILNAVWMAIETDANDMDVLSQAPVGFQIVEHAFCTLFLLELMIRLFAYQKMTECIYDAWFRFDFVLVSLLVVETWLVPLGSMLASADEESHNKLSIFRLLRLLRLSRVTKLLHAAPEIAVLIKGMLAASRSVLVTMLLLVFLLCVFGLVCRTQAKSDTYLEDLYFGSVGQSMWTLFLHGTLLDSVSVPMNILKERNVGMCIIFTVFVFLSNLTVMNMLIGILCDVVARVKVEETDRDERHQLRSALSKMLECYDFNHNGLLEEKEFVLLMENPDIIEILKKFGTDVGGLLTLSSIVFADCTGLSKAGSLSFDEFLDLAARLKGDHSARVTDVVEQREYTRQRLDQLETEVLQCQQELKEGVECIIASLPKGSKMKTIR
jgi:voltage-gated sodium channel